MSLPRYCFHLTLTRRWDGRGDGDGKTVPIRMPLLTDSLKCMRTGTFELLNLAKAIGMAQVRGRAGLSPVAVGRHLRPPWRHDECFYWLRRRLQGALPQRSTNKHPWTGN